jgi:hypothetical protein
MTNMEEMVKAIREYREKELLESADAVYNFVVGFVEATRKQFDKDNKGGLYGA